VADTHRDASVSTLVYRSDEKGTRWEKDFLVAEEPLEIRLREGGAEPERFVVTMRTPGDDDDLVAGLLYGEGVIEEIGLANRQLTTGRARQRRFLRSFS